MFSHILFGLFARGIREVKVVDCEEVRRRNRSVFVSNDVQCTGFILTFIDWIDDCHEPELSGGKDLFRLCLF